MDVMNQQGGFSEFDKSYHIVAITAGNILIQEGKQNCRYKGIYLKPVRLEDLKKLFAEYFKQIPFIKNWLFDIFQPCS